MTAKPCGGRETEKVLGAIEVAIRSGRYASGDFLPSVRELSIQHKVSPETVRRGLKLLEKKGLLIAEACRGFRVAHLVAGENFRQRPVAYVTDHREDLSDAQPANWAIMAALQRASAAIGSTVLGVHSGGKGGEGVVERIKAGGARGIALDTMNRPMLDAVRSAGVPIVLVNCGWEDAGFDIVQQDNYRGGFLAARHLLESGCRRIAWFGALGRYYHSRERYAGACAALAEAGRHFDGAARVEAEGADAFSAALELLGRVERPDGVLAFGAGAMAAVCRACRQTGLRPEADLRMIGWTVEDCYAAVHLPLFPDGPVPPAVVWKASSMAEATLGLLEERANGKGGEPKRICVPTRIRFAEG